MTAYPVYSLETAPEGAKPALQRLRDNVGLIPNLAGAMANSPTLIEAFVGLREVFQKGTFTPLERETIALTGAVANECGWCVAAHSTFAQKANLPAEALEALRAGRFPGDPRLRALSQFARKMTVSRGRLEESDLREFLAAGYSPAQALEVIVGVAVSVLANYAGRLVDAPLDGFLQPQAWKASA